MKKFNFKKIAVMSLAAMMAVSAMSVSAFAEDNAEPLIIQPYSLGEGFENDNDMSDDFELFAVPFGYVNGDNNKTLYRYSYAGANSLEISFTLDKPNFKVWVQNDSMNLRDGAITYHVHVFCNGVELKGFDVESNTGGQTQAYNNNNIGDKCTVVIENDEGRDVKGLITVRSELYELN